METKTAAIGLEVMKTTTNTRMHAATHVSSSGLDCQRKTRKDSMWWAQSPEATEFKIIANTIPAHKH
eukprot:5600148-Amphidinium_carterae.1